METEKLDQFDVIICIWCEKRFAQNGICPFCKIKCDDRKARVDELRAKSKEKKNAEEKV